MKNLVTLSTVTILSMVLLFSSCKDGASGEKNADAPAAGQNGTSPGDASKKAVIQAAVDATTSSADFKKAAAESGMTLNVVNDSTVQMGITMPRVKKATADPKTISSLGSDFKVQMIKWFKEDPSFKKLADAKPHFTAVIYDEDKAELARTEINSNEF